SWNALHAAELANKATLAKYEKLATNNSKQAATAAITEDLDSGVGKVLEAVDQLGLSENTYIIYMSDNGSGGGGRRGGLSGGKGSVWEGGIRVPLIVRGPKVTANSWCHAPVVGYDFLPTLCALAGVPSKELPRDIEGGDITSLLHHSGEGVVKRQREELVFHFPHYQSDDGPHSAIRLGNLKLIHFYEDNRVAMFDLAKEIGEREDLAQQMPKDVQELKGRLDQYLAAINAQLPTSNPSFDPSQPVAPRKGGKNRKQGTDKK
ncbi:MAG: sulfatase-like hydrolase/transferase, partial [Pirellula sp.]